MAKFGRFGQGSGKFAGFGQGSFIQKLPNDSGKINEIPITFGDFRGGFDSRVLRDGIPANASLNCIDVDVNKKGRLIRIAGNTLINTLDHSTKQFVLHPSLSGWSELVFFAPPYIGVKRTDTISWINLDIQSTGKPVVFTLFGDQLIFYSGRGDPFIRKPDTTPIAAPTIPGANAYATFANRVYAGGVIIDGEYQPMGESWSGISGDPTDFTGDGSGSELLIDDPTSGDHIVAHRTMGLGHMAILCRHSIWDAQFTGLLNRPADFEPKIVGSGIRDEATARATPRGVIYLSDDGVRLYDGNSSTILSYRINGEILPLSVNSYSASYDPTRNRYTLHTPTESWIYDLNEDRWIKTSLVAMAGVLFGTQLGGVTWAEITGDWSSYANVTWQDLERHEADDAEMYYLNGTSKLAKHDPAGERFFDLPMNPLWETPQTRGFSLTNLVESKGIIVEYVGAGIIKLGLPNFNSYYETVYPSISCPQQAKPKELWIPIVHTGLTAGISLSILSGNLEIVQMQLLTQAVSPKIDAADLSAPAIFESDAIVKIRPVFVDSFGAGKAQSLGDGVNETDTGKYDLVFGDWDYFATGGRENGGYASPTTSSGSLILSPPTAEIVRPRQSSLFTTHNLFGRIPTVPETIHYFSPHIKVQLMPDLTFRAVSEDYLGSDNYDTRILAISSIKVPSNDWWSLETEAGTAAEGYIKGGFVKSNLYTEGGPLLGQRVLNAIGVYTRAHSILQDFDEGIYNFTIGVPRNTGICCVILNSAYGATARSLYDTLAVAALPIADGDVVQSLTSHEHHEDVANLTNVGMTLALGSTDRWRNVRNITSDIHQLLSETWHMGTVGLFSGEWSAPPVYPPSPDPIAHNLIVDTALDLYRVSTDRTNIAVIDGISPIVLAGFRHIRAVTDNAFGGGGPGNWNFASEHELLEFKEQSAIRTLVRTNSGTIIKGRIGIGYIFGGGHQSWYQLKGYDISPFGVIERDAGSDARFDIAALPQAGIQGTFELLDPLTPTTDQRFIETSVILGGYDIIYRKQEIIAMHQLFHPIAFFIVTIDGLGTGFIQLYDISVDFNGTQFETVTSIILRTIDWGDLTTPSTIGTGPANPASHTYARHGTYTAVLTVKNVQGLTNSYSQTFTVPIGSIVSSFSITTDPSDISGLTIKYTNTSHSQNGAVVASSWNFGDGNTATTVNPIHLYSGAGTYVVSLTVTDDVGQQNTFSASVVVPQTVGGTDCSFSDDAVQNEAFVQGDDFHGGNPPLPAYANTAAFDTYYYGTIFREAYDNAYDNIHDSISHTIDTVVKFDGHNTLKMGFGSIPAPSGHSFYFGAGWDCVPTDDGTPTESYYDASPFGPLVVWHRVRWKAEAGIMSDSGVVEGSQNQGLQVASIVGYGTDVNIFIRGGRVKLDINRRPTSGGAFTTTTYDLGPESVFVDRPDGFGELVWRYDASVANKVGTKIWLGDACTLGGTDPIVDTGALDAFTTHLNEVQYVSHFNWTFTPTGDVKYLWVADWKLVPESVNADPFNILGGGGGGTPRVHFSADHFPSGHFLDADFT